MKVNKLDDKDLIMCLTVINSFTFPQPLGMKRQLEGGSLSAH